MGRIDTIADRFVDRWADLDPVSATALGIGGHDDQMTDLSPDGFAAQAELTRRTLAEIDPIEPADERERVAKESMQERLGLELARYDAGEVTSELNVIASPLHNVRDCFELMPMAGAGAAENIAARLVAVPRALDQFQQTLRAAADQGHLAARYQMLAVADQCAAWADPARDDMFTGLARRVRERNDNLPAALAAELDRAGAAANDAAGRFGEFLRTEMAPRAPEKQAVGPDRYALASRYFLGAAVDLEETYAWGFAELARIEAEMRQVADKISPGGTVDDAVAALDADPERSIASKEAFRDWMQELADQSIRDLDGTHFDIPEPVRHIECRIAPTSDGGVYYTGPNEDFTRPGRMWWAVPAGITEFSTWREVTTVYHEGVPGHHLQVAQTAVRADVLNRWQRMLSWCSGHGEGWALYAETLMDELGYLQDPGDRLGMLDGQALRAARVVVDIGMHLELAIPADNPFGFHPGERFTPELGWQFMREHCRIPDENLRFEVDRYLGWPGQAPSYLVGQRIWLQARAEAKARKGAGFDLKAFHRAALDLGPLGLDPLRAALARI